MAGSTRRAAPEPRAEPAGGFSEREFYLREFRGRTLAIAVPEGCGAGPEALGPVLETLEGGGARTLVLAPRAEAARAPGPAVLADDHPRLEGEVWRRLRASPRLRLAVTVDGDFAEACRGLAVRLGIFKMVWLDAGGGLRAAGGVRESFVHLDELRELLEEGGAGLEGPERLPLWRQVVAMLEAGVPAVNVCSPEGLDAELFTYAGSGTLFTRDRYVTVRDLGVDDFDAAFDLIQRGVAEGYLAPREPEALDAVLANAFGAFVEDRHLAGIAALLDGGDGRSAELASLYTLTRFLGEGVGDSLLEFAVGKGGTRGCAYVFACTTSERVGAFFERNGFRAVGQGAIPERKWQSYDPSRRERVRCYRLDLPGDPRSRPETG